jgi:uncharacterized protein YjeT (DUF2065 family)
MPTNLPDLFDTLLIMAGLVLVATGLVMFIRSKTSTQASSVEAFGIKLNVTHPSLILVLAGVGLMLAPRLLPEPAGRAEKPEPVVATTTPASPASPAPAAQSVVAATPTPAPVEAAAPPATPALKPAAVSPPAAPAISLARPAPALKPRTAEAAPPKKPTPTPLRVPKPSPAPTVAALAERPTVIPPVTAQPTRPTLAFAALGLPIDRSFWSGETRASYTQRMRTSLQRAGRDVLHMDTRGLDLGQAEFDAWWNESRQTPKSRALCAAPHAPLALLSARVETPTTISSVESAHWPELKLRLFVCANLRVYRQQKTLAPQNDDAWPFASELNSETERFLRTYRGDLAGD